jgi:DNA-binding NarL/FixJ family response regulator
MIRIVIVDDHDLVREGIRALLEQDPELQVVGETGDGQEAIRLAARLRPDVLLMDVKTIILTQYENREYIKRAIHIGARGYLLKRSVSAQLKEAIRTVARGERYLHPLAAEELVELVTSGRTLDEDEYEQLTAREKQVFKLLAEGKTSRDIAKYLNISLKTAMTHRTNIMAKLNMHSRTELVRYAIRKAIIPE